MKRVLLKKTAIGKNKSLQVEMEDHVIRLTVRSGEETLKAGFAYEEWEKFVDGVKEANASMAVEED